MSTSTFGATVQETVVPLTSEHPVARVDLMPEEVWQSRRFARARGWMAASVVVSLLGCAGAWWLASEDAAQAQDELATAQAQTVALQAEAAQYASVPAMVASVDRAKGALDIAMATDIEYYRYLAQLGAVAPEGVWFSDLTFSAVPLGTVAADPLAPTDTVADLSMTGAALSYQEVASLLDAVDGVTAIDHVMFANTAYQDDGSKEKPFVEFQTNAKLTPDAYSGRYARTSE